MSIVKDIRSRDALSVACTSEKNGILLVVLVFFAALILSSASSLSSLDNLEMRNTEGKKKITMISFARNVCASAQRLNLARLPVQ